MTLRLTPRAIVAAYEYLRTTAPFNKWGLPDADDLAFEVTPHVDRYGHFKTYPKRDNRYQIIAISALSTKTTLDLIGTMAHECVHLKQFMDRGYRARGQGHGPTFKALARDVCRVHGFDLKTF